jgi:putative DNA primase/helicase
MWGIDSPDKRYYPRGLTKKGGYFVIYGYQTIANIYDPILLCEGYATACSLHEATGFTTYLSFDAGNLINVLKMIRNKYPQKKILICADDDHATKGNPGITHAINCSTSDHDFMVRYIIPNFPFRNVGDKSRTDFNDLHVLYGLEEVNRQIMEAINVF